MIYNVYRFYSYYVFDLFQVNWRMQW